MCTQGSEKAILLHEDVIRGHHVYKSVWSPVLGETLTAAQERGNPMDRFAIAVQREDTIIGHVPCTISKVFWYFIEHGGMISCEVTGQRRHGKGLEVPCLYKLLGEEKMINKAKKLIAKSRV